MLLSWGNAKEEKMSYWPRKSWSQMGEDLVIENNLGFFGLKSESITYLDIGTNDPCDSNNTYLFYEKGARGILVEPDEMYWPRIEDKRPEDQLLKFCVGDVNKEEADFYVMTAHSLNTLVKETADHVCTQAGYGHQIIEEIKKREVVNINKVLSTYGCPNLISIDTEGMDHIIIKAINFEKFKPEIICVEANEGRDDMISTLTHNGYGIIGDNVLNLIFKRLK